MIDSLGLEAYFSKIHLTPLIKGRISIKFLILFHIFRDLIADVKKNKSIQLDQVITEKF